MNLRTLLYTFGGTLGVFLVLFSWSTYRYYEIVHADDPIHPTLEASAGTSKVVRADYTYTLSEKETFPLENNDIVETNNESRATITWPDKSITRLGPKTRIVIEKMYASNSYDDIQVAYRMERGKVWNTVIRTLVGDSYFEVRLPKNSIVAGVRGTIFEINLDNRYIHAVNHSTYLTQKGKSSVLLLPGELVDSENIWVKKGKEWLDATWSEWNTRADTLYQSLKALEIQKHIEALTKDIGKISLSNATRSLIEKMPGFEDIRIAEYIEKKQINKLQGVSSEKLLSYYQKLGNLGNTETKETLRNAMLSIDNGIIAKFRDSLKIHAFWDSIDTGKLTASTQDYLKEKGIDTVEFQSKFIEGAKNDISHFRETFSGGINGLIGF